MFDLIFEHFERLIYVFVEECLKMNVFDAFVVLNPLEKYEFGLADKHFNEKKDKFLSFSQLYHLGESQSSLQSWIIVFRLVYTHLLMC